MLVECVERNGVERTRLTMGEDEQGAIYDALVDRCEALDSQWTHGDWGTPKARNAKRALPAFRLLRDTLHAADGVVVISNRDATRIMDALYFQARWMEKLPHAVDRARLSMEFRADMLRQIVTLRPDLAAVADLHDRELANT